MADQVEHCPFLNRSDERCAENFNIDHLQHAFRFCFGRYKACPTYTTMLVERMARRGAVAQRLASHMNPADHGSHDDRRLVQVTVCARHALHAAGAS
jgi:hypothetical protein